MQVRVRDRVRVGASVTMYSSIVVIFTHIGLADSVTAVQPLLHTQLFVGTARHS